MSSKLCMIIGDPVAHSLSPQIHNAAYRALGISGEYSYEARRVKTDELAAFMDEVRAQGIRGISCTAPHKVAIMRYLDEIDAVARKIGAVNTVVNDDGMLKGYNTDWLGVVLPLEKLTSLKGKKVALLGAGGAARSIAYGITDKGADLTIYNRTVAAAQALAKEYSCDSAQIEDPRALEAIKSSDIVINATSVGMEPDTDRTPLPRQYMHSKQIVFDSIYTPYDTRLLREARQQGAQTVHGTEMLLQQGIAQFKLYTGYDAPEDAMRTALNEAIQARGEQL